MCLEIIFNSFHPGQNGHDFTDDVFGSIFVNEKICFAIQISLKFFPNGYINNKPALI